jgi:hypothetical protein
MQGAMSAIQWQPVLEVLVLGVWANAAPVLLRLFLGTRLGAPVDSSLGLVIAVPARYREALAAGS